MDLSKLPKMSETPRPPATVEPMTTSRKSEAIPASAAEAWISIAVGVIMLLMYPRFLQWIFSRLFGTNFNEFMLDGAVVPYPQVPEFWSDLGPTSFGVVLIIEGLILGLAPKRPLVWFAFVLTVGVVLYNLIYVVTSYSRYGLALISAIAVAFGVYIAMHQWRLLQTRSHAPPSA